jgi:hypothetical protein
MSNHQESMGMFPAAIDKILEKSMFNYFRAVLMCVMILTPTAVWATRPFTVDDTATEGRGNFLFELTGVSAKDSSVRSTVETAVITAGAAEHTDLSLEIPYLMLDPSSVTGQSASGMGDMQFKFKQQIFENEVRQSMAYEFYANLPTGDNVKGLGTNNVVWGGRLIDTQECHNNAFHLNVGYELYGRDLKHWHFAQDHAFTFGFAAEHKFTEAFRLLAELWGESRKETDLATETESHSRPFTFSAGCIYDVSRSWYVDLGAQVGLNKDAEDYAILGGLAWRF